MTGIDSRVHGIRDNYINKHISSVYLPSIDNHLPLEEQMKVGRFLVLQDADLYGGTTELVVDVICPDRGRSLLRLFT